MKISKLVICSLILLTVAAAGAKSAPAVRNSAMTGRTANVDPQEQRLREWLRIQDETGTWPVETGAMPKEQSEREFLSDVLKNRAAFASIATGSGNGGGPVGLDFLKDAKIGLMNCGADKDLTPSQYSKLNRDFYRAQIFPVAFNLCSSLERPCRFDESFTAKNYPDDLIILVNVVKWNQLKIDDRIDIALHEFLGIVGAEQETYGISSRYHLRTVQWPIPGGVAARIECVKSNQ